jgi:ANTAR domain/PAS fold
MSVSERHSNPLSCPDEPPVAAYRYDALADVVWWSPEMYALLGYEVDEVVPTLQLMEAHIAAEDRQRVRDEVCPRWEQGQPFTTRHHLVDVDGGVHIVLAVGESIRVGGRCLSVQAYYVDVTTSVRRDVSANVTAALTRTLRTRGVIEQAKGALMLAYGVEEDDAFALLRGLSNNHNVKVADLASYVVRRMPAAGVATGPAQETLFEILAAVADDPGVVRDEADRLVEAPLARKRVVAPRDSGSISRI